MTKLARHTRKEVAKAIDARRCTLESVTLYAGTPRSERYYILGVEQPSEWNYIVRRSYGQFDEAVALFRDADLVQGFLLGLKEE